MWHLRTSIVLAGAVLVAGVTAGVVGGQGVPEDKVYRRVVIVLDGPEGVAIDGGSVKVTTSWDKDPQPHAEATWEVKGGRAEGDVRVPGRIVTGGPWEFSVPGYWVEPLPEEVAVPDAFGALEIHVKARPAGRVQGRVVHADGTPFPGWWNVGVMGVTWPGWVKKGESPNLQGAQVKEGTADFQLDGLPLGGTYQLFMMAGHGRLAISKAVPVDEKHLATTVDMVLPEGVTVAGAVVDQDGNPARKVQVGLTYSSFGFQAATDDAGKFAFEHVDFDLPEPWSLSIAPSDALDTQGLILRSLTKDSLGKLKQLQLKAGVTVTGTVIDDRTGKPVTHRQVGLSPVDDRAAAYPGGGNTTTDGSGSFAIHTLEPIAYRVWVEGCAPAGKAGAVVTGGEKTAAEIHVLDRP